jgi:hypothetical protein
MDPFIEGQEWDDFHPEFITDLRASLAQLVPTRYVVRVERRVYLERVPEEEERPAQPDLLVLRQRREEAPPRGATGVVVYAPSVERTLPIPEEHREPFLTIRERGTMEVVTVLELLSPTNKRPGADGHREYLSKRAAVLLSAAHLVEIDLLRGGRRLPTREPLPTADYYAVISREERRPQACIFFWTLREALPTVPIPLGGSDADVPLDLQAAFQAAYGRARYELSLDYQASLRPPLSEEDTEWMRERLAAAQQRGV